MSKRRNHAFTLIELLVVISIIALLVSILLPALNEARNTARRVVCSSGMKSCGTGMSTYCTDSKGMMPYQSWSSGGPWNCATLFHGDVLKDSVPAQQYRYTQHGPIDLWCKPFGMGALYQTGIVDEIKMFFCPGASASAQAAGSINLNPDYYTEPTTGDLIATLQQTSIVRVRSAYHYFKNNIRSIDKMGSLSYYYDAVDRWDEIAHKSSNGAPKGFNVLFGDSHVEFQNDEEINDEDLWGYPYGSDPGNYPDVWYKIMRNKVSVNYHVGNNMPDLNQVQGNTMNNWMCNEAFALGGQFLSGGWRYDK